MHGGRCAGRSPALRRLPLPVGNTTHRPHTVQVRWQLTRGDTCTRLTGRAARRVAFLSLLSQSISHMEGRGWVGARRCSGAPLVAAARAERRASGSGSPGAQKSKRVSESVSERPIPARARFCMHPRCIPGPRRLPRDESRATARGRTLLSITHVVCSAREGCGLAAARRLENSDPIRRAGARRER